MQNNNLALQILKFKVKVCSYISNIFPLNWKDWSCRRRQIVIKFTKNYQAVANFKVMSVEWATFYLKEKERKKNKNKNKESLSRI